MINYNKIREKIKDFKKRETKESIQKFLDELDNEPKIEDNRSFSQRDWEQILYYLENPPEPTEFLINEMRKYKEKNLEWDGLLKQTSVNPQVKEQLQMIVKETK